MGAKRRVAIIAASVAVLVVVVSALAMMYAQRGRGMLRASLEVLMHQKLNLVDYRVEGMVQGYSISDLAATWWVVLDARSSSVFAQSPQFASADEADLEDYKRAFRDALRPGESLDGFKLYRAEMRLSEGTICDVTQCNVAILAKQGNSNVYVSISKT